MDLYYLLELLLTFEKFEAKIYKETSSVTDRPSTNLNKI